MTDTIKSLQLLQTDEFELSKTANDWLCHLGGKNIKMVLHRFETPYDIVKRTELDMSRNLPTKKGNIERDTKSLARKRRKKLLGNFASPTQGFLRGNWKHPRPQQYRRRAIARVRNLPAIRRKANSKVRKQNKGSVNRGIMKTHPKTSGEFYKERRCMRKSMEEEHQLLLLSERRIRMEKKLEETVSAFTFMTQAFTKSMQLLEDSIGPPSAGKRAFPRLLEHMSRNLKRTQNMMRDMTRAVNEARRQEQDFIARVR